MSKPNKILIVGAGVSGLTTAITLQLYGFETQIISKQHPFIVSGSSDFSSQFPAASVIPHSIVFDNLLELFDESNQIFKQLMDYKCKGIEVHHHFELFSEATAYPDYMNSFKTFKPLDKSTNNFQLNHPTLNSNFGWHFDCLFVDWGIYYPQLLDWYINLGGELRISEVTQESLRFLPGEIIINCAELYGPNLLGESIEPIIYRGHLLHVLKNDKLRDRNGKLISYNFTPSNEVYSTENGVEQDVYLYQRSDRWIFGGSRQRGTLNADKEWKGELVIDPKIILDEKVFPKQILEINAEIIKHSFGESILDTDQIIGKIGYRYMGNKKEKLRLDSTEIENKLVINNFGHGGSGVTLSWGCAHRVLNIVNEKLNLNNERSTEIATRLARVISP